MVHGFLRALHVRILRTWFLRIGLRRSGSRWQASSGKGPRALGQRGLVQRGPVRQRFLNLAATGVALTMAAPRPTPRARRSTRGRLLRPAWC